MWNDRQKAQKLDIDLARIKRDVADQDREFADLMAEHYVTHKELDALAAKDREEHEEAAARESTAPAPVLDSGKRFVVRG